MLLGYSEVWILRKISHLKLIVDKKDEKIKPRVFFKLVFAIETRQHLRNIQQVISNMYISTYIGYLHFKHLWKTWNYYLYSHILQKKYILQQKFTFLMNDKYAFETNSLNIQLKILIFLNYKISYCSLEAE